MRADERAFSRSRPYVASAEGDAEHLSLTRHQRAEVHDFENPEHELRRLFAELLGTYLLLVVAVGAGVVNRITHGALGLGGEVVAPALMIVAIVLFMGSVSGAHLNPAVTLAFSLRRDFPWRRLPGYVVAQTLGSVLGALTIRGLFGIAGGLGATRPGSGFSSGQAFLVEVLVTGGLISVVLGVASGAQAIGPMAAVAAGAYITLAGLWAGPVSGASMNPARSFGPALVGGDLGSFWIYLSGPLLGSVLAVGASYLLRGPGGKKAAERQAAQGLA